MARLLKAVWAAVLLAFVLSLLLPSVAVADDAAPWVGTYKGVGVGKNAKGEKARSGVTVWVEDAGGSTKLTFRFDRFPAVISRTVPNAGGTKGSMLLRITVDEPGVRGSGLIVVYPKAGNYLMAGKGAGTALKKRGTGRMGAVRTSTGVALPSMDQQVKDLFSAVFNRKVKSSSTSGGASGGGSQVAAAAPALFSDDAGVVRVASAGDETAGEAAAAQDDPEAVVKQAPDVVFVKAVAVEPASMIDLAESRPPVATQTALTATVLLVALTGIAAIVSVGPRVRRAAAVDADRPNATGEGS
jgi:hypothetical protein